MGHLFQEGGCDERGPRGRELRALLLTCRDLVALVLLGRSQHGGSIWRRCPGVGEGGSQHRARATLLPY